MTTRWKVLYEFQTGIKVVNPVLSYPSMGLTLQYEGEKLLRIERELDIDDAVEPAQVLDKSEADLKLFWELLEYRWRLPLPPLSKSIERIQDQPTTQGRTLFIQSTLSASIHAPVIMPKTSELLCDNTRILVWLKLANEARKYDSAADAIRNYYMIWEDLHSGQNKEGWPREAIELNYVRDFVSHAKITNKNLLTFLKQELGEETFQFDPTNARHIDFINRYYLKCRKLVENELDKQL